MRDSFQGVSEQSKAGKHRTDDSWALLNAVRWRGATYMAGYAIECLLKTKLMRMYGCRHLRELEDELQSKASSRFKPQSLRINLSFYCG